jgi:predicted enzyme related to lactoylglutathione lyase
MIRHIVLACALLFPTIALAQSAGGTGAPVVFFTIFGPQGEQLQQFYSGLFEWKIAPNGDVTTAVSSPLPANIGKGESETIVYVGVDDITATLAKVKERGGTVRFPRFEVPGRVVLAVFKDPAGNSVGLVELENGKAKIPTQK